MLPCVEVEARGQTTASVVWMHGLGANGHDFEPVVPMLGCTATRFVFPHAPTRPVSINGGWVMPAWYDLRSLDDRPAREDADDVRASAESIVALVRREEERGIASDRIVIAGFSQGAAMALHVGLRYERPLAGILVLSGYEVLSATAADEWHEAQRTTPILFAHGTYDPVVSLEMGKRAFRHVSGWSRGAVEWAEYPMEHRVSPPEIERIGAWLQRLEGRPR